MQIAEGPPLIADEVPWSERLTDYDNAHFTIYLRLLDASADKASDEEMARDILDVDPQAEPERAMKSLRSHLERARWIATTGYRHLFRSNKPHEPKSASVHFRKSK